MNPPVDITALLSSLRDRYGRIEQVEPKTPFAHVLFQNASYLVDDERSVATLRQLEEIVGLSPHAILAANDAELGRALQSGGPMLNGRIKKIRSVARTAVDKFAGDLDRAIARDPESAEKYLRNFVSIGAPGAAKIALFSGIKPCLALDSNGLRVLMRIGLVAPRPSFATIYRAMIRLLEPQIPVDFDQRIEAFQLLKRHGQELCKRASPRCRLCPISAACKYFAPDA